MSTNNGAYKIRQVVELTGASEFLLRVWENRYSAFNPTRSKTGRRLYNENDVLKARTLLALTEQGHRIGEIAELSLFELNKLIQQKTKTDTPPDSFAKLILTKANQFKWQDVRDLLSEKKSKSQTLNWIHNIIVPLLIEMSKQADGGNFSIAQEHILSSIIKEQLITQIKKSPKKETRNTRLVIAAPEGDFHDMGLLIANQIANEFGINTLFLGPHMPKDELSAVCVRYQATHLLLTSTTEKADGAKDDYLHFLNFLDRNLDQKIKFWLAGRNSLKYSVNLNRDYLILKNFKEFEVEAQKIIKKRGTHDS